MPHYNIIFLDGYRILSTGLAGSISPQNSSWRKGVKIFWYSWYPLTYEGVSKLTSKRMRIVSSSLISVNKLFDAMAIACNKVSFWMLLCMLVFSPRLFLNYLVRKFFEFLMLILRFNLYHIIISYLNINSWFLGKIFHFAVFLSRHNISFKVIGGESKL